jgi:hypothetical protein
MTVRPLLLATAALLVSAPAANASTILGSLDTDAAPDTFACATACPRVPSVGFQQFALKGATVEAPEDGVLVSTSVHAKRIAGAEDPLIAVLRPGDGNGMAIVGTAPVPISSAVGERVQMDDLHLPVQRGDSIGFVFRPGEVDLGVRARPRPDGAVQSFATPCDPCGMDGGTGMELLFDAVVEPDTDGDSMGDESQDADGGGLGMDWEDDWFEDFEEGDELDPEPVFAEQSGGGRVVPRDLRLIDASRRSVVITAPKAGRISISITLPAKQKTGEGPFTTILTGEKRVKRAGRVRLRLKTTPAGAKVLSKRRRVRTKAVVAYFPRKAQLELLMRSARL